jgi:lipid II:glycine glycyltransferase (peptidoglycan interpeptide bridge formation enzyme)
MRKRLDDGKWKYIEIRPIHHLPNGITGFVPSVNYHLHRLDLRPDTHELFRRFHKDCVQRKIRRAEREKLRYDEGASEDLLQEFYRLLVMTRRRQFLPPQPLAWFRALIGAFGKDLKIRVASEDGVAVASILTLSHKKSMVYKYGCSNAAFNRFGGTALLFWRTIQDAKDLGFEELEMGRSNLDNLGLVAFKERWGATRKSISYWTYPQNPTPAPNVWKKKMAQHVVSAVPDLALEAIGQLFYRHIG